MLELETRVDCLTIDAADIVGRIQKVGSHFKVMIRPLKAINALQA